MEVTDAMRVSIAAQACLPILELGLDWYSGWTGIVVYPGDFRVRRSVLVELGAPHAEVARVDDDAGPAGVPVQAQLEDRQAGLRGDRDAHRVGHLHAVRAGELLLGEKQQHQLLQLLFLTNEFQAPRGGSPKRVVHAMPGKHALAAPVGQPAHLRDAIVTPAMISAMPTAWCTPKRSPRKATPMAAPKNGIRCMNTPARAAPTAATPRFQK